MKTHLRVFLTLMWFLMSQSTSTPPLGPTKVLTTYGKAARNPVYKEIAIPLAFQFFFFTFVREDKRGCKSCSWHVRLLATWVLFKLFNGTQENTTDEQLKAWIMQLLFNKSTNSLLVLGGSCGKQQMTTTKKNEFVSFVISMLAQRDYGARSFS